MRNAVLAAAKCLLLVTAMSWGASASAVQIDGSFTLTADLRNPGAQSTGPTTRGTFGYESDDIAFDALSDLYFAPLNAFDLTLAGDTFGLGSFTGPGSFGPFALLTGPNPGSIVGLSGTAFGTPNGVELTLSTDVDKSPQPTFTSSAGGYFTASFSGNQSIPEPSALALLGIGLLAAFAFTGTRRKRSA